MQIRYQFHASTAFPEITAPVNERIAGWWSRDCVDPPEKRKSSGDWRLATLSSCVSVRRSKIFVILGVFYLQIDAKVTF
jgi:hypothetical protein